MNNFNTVLEKIRLEKINKNNKILYNKGIIYLYIYNKNVEFLKSKEV